MKLRLRTDDALVKIISEDYRDRFFNKRWEALKSWRALDLYAEEDFDRDTRVDPREGRLASRGQYSFTSNSPTCWAEEMQWYKDNKATIDQRYCLIERREHGGSTGACSQTGDHETSNHP